MKLDQTPTTLQILEAIPSKPLCSIYKKSWFFQELKANSPDSFQGSQLIGFVYSTNTIIGSVYELCESNDYKKLLSARGVNSTPSFFNSHFNVKPVNPHTCNYSRRDILEYSRELKIPSAPYPDNYLFDLVFLGDNKKEYGQKRLENLLESISNS